MSSSALWQLLFLMLLDVHPPSSPGENTSGGAGVVANSLSHAQVVPVYMIYQ